LKDRFFKKSAGTKFGFLVPSFERDLLSVDEAVLVMTKSMSRYALTSDNIYKYLQLNSRFDVLEKLRRDKRYLDLKDPDQMSNYKSELFDLGVNLFNNKSQFPEKELVDLCY